MLLRYSLNRTTKCAELKFLHRAVWRYVVVVSFVHQVEALAKNGCNTCCVMPGNRKPAASFRAIRSERADDRDPAGIESSAQCGCIGALLVQLGQEMERRAIMPDIISSVWMPMRHIGYDPLNGFSNFS